MASSTTPARYRKTANGTIKTDTPTHPVSPSTGEFGDDAKHNGLSLLDVIRIVSGILLLSGALSYFITGGDSLLWGYRPWFTRPEVLKQKIVTGSVSLTDAELLKYDGTNAALPIYLALNGAIYDVSASPSTYGPGGSYSHFAGKDAARAFLTGCFAEDGTPDLRGVEDMYIPIDDPEDDAKLSSGAIKARREKDVRVANEKMKETLDHWAQVFRGETGRPYFEVGRVKRQPGWLERSEARALCEQAQRGRQSRRSAEAIEKATRDGQ